MAFSLYLDEDAMMRALLQGLRARGADVLTAFEANMLGRDDEEQLAFATSEDRTIYTFNVADFCRLHADYVTQSKRHAGIIVVPRQRYGVGDQIRGLLELQRTRTTEQMQSRLIFLRI